MSTRADLIKAGIVKPAQRPAILVANKAAILARRRDVKTKSEKAMNILRAAMRRA